MSDPPELPMAPKELPPILPAPDEPLPNHEHGTDPHRPPARPATCHGIRWPEWIMAISTVGILVATGVNVGVARYQWKAMERQSKAMEEANTLTKAAQQAAKEAEDKAHAVAADADRPWVSIYVTQVPSLVAGTRPQIQLTLLNTGKSPAAHVVAVYSFTMPAALPTAAKFTGQREGPFVILPVGPIERILALGTELLPEHITEIQSAKRWFVVRAEVAYKDRIGRNHRTGFCQFSSGGNFYACGAGNYAD